MGFGFLPVTGHGKASSCEANCEAPGQLKEVCVKLNCSEVQNVSCWFEKIMGNVKGSLEYRSLQCFDFRELFLYR